MTLIGLCGWSAIALADPAVQDPAPAALDPADAPAPPPAQAQQGGQKGQGGQGDGKQGKKGQGQKKKADQQKYPYWQTEPYLTPELGLSSYSSGGDTSAALSLGAQAGVRYVRVDRERPWVSGRTRAAGTYLLSNGAGSGFDIRLGSFLGPQWESANIQVGPDVFYNRSTWGSVELEPSIGVGVPATATRSADVFTVYGGVEPAWLLNEDRRVDWDDTDSVLPGFGHEFTYRAGVSVAASFASLSLSYQYKITAYGIEQGFGVGVKLKAG